mgnify:CR=1 FL=1|tara:strand:- start:919 stop:2079 length:1161 start_codon:yes stop_codon:yes gene_type:complete
MKIHEYQGKKLFREAGVPVPDGQVAFSIEEALKITKELNSDKVVIKAQIHAGGRGKGGGVKIASNLDEVKEISRKMLGMNLITHQTGRNGKQVQRLLVEEASDIKEEFYAGIVLDRNTSKFVFMVSKEGGMEIEEVAASTPEKIIKEWINPCDNLRTFQARKLAFALGLKGRQIQNAIRTFMLLWKICKRYDCSLIEVNPLVITNNDQVIALDSKINFDDNALYRNNEIINLRDLSEEEESEIEAKKHSLNYIKLDGNVGCMVNGAGLAMGTMDIIKTHGGQPANFLDVGGIANSNTVAQGFKIILSDPNVKSILINIFGGIVRCDRVAEGVIEAMNKINVTIPIIIRLEGTNSELAKDLLIKSKNNFIVAKNLRDAADKAVSAAK